MRGCSNPWPSFPSCTYRRRAPSPTSLPPTRPERPRVYPASTAAGWNWSRSPSLSNWPSGRSGIAATRVRRTLVTPDIPPAPRNGGACMPFRDAAVAGAPLRASRRYRTTPTREPHELRLRTRSPGFPGRQPRHRTLRTVHSRRQRRAARQAAAPRRAAGRLPQRPAAAEHHPRADDERRGRRGLWPGLGRRRHRLPRLPPARQPGAPALAADPDGGGAGQHAPERGPARQRRRSAPPPGAHHRRAEERGLSPGDGRRAGVLPARP